jgi:amino acid transporter
MAAEEPLLFVRQASGLTRAISSYTVIFFGLGLNFLPFQYFLMGNIPFIFPGVDLISIYFFGGLFVLLEVVGMSLLYVAMPRSGSIYVPMSRSISPMLGMMEAWRSIIQNPTQRGVTAFLGASQFAAFTILTGKFTGNAGLIELGNAFSANPWNLVAVGFLIQVIGLIANHLGPGIMGKWVAVFGVGAVIGISLVSVSFIGALGNLQPRWDSTFGSGAYNEIVRLATNNGFTAPTPSLSVTLAAALIPISTTFPYTVMPLVGEVEKPRKNIPISMIGSGVGVLFFNTIATWGYVSSYGTFANMYHFVTTNSALASQMTITKAFPIDLSSMAAAVSGNPTMSALTAFSPQWSNFNDVIVNNAFCSRPLFALAMDRMGPAVFATVSQRWHSPVAGNLFWFFVSLPTLFLSAVDSSGTVGGIIGGTVFAFALARSMQHWSEVALPITRPEIAQQGFNIKIGGIDLMSILGGISTAVFLYLIGTNPPQSQYSALYVLAMYGIGIFFFIYYSAKNAKRGISINQIFARVPPE